MRMQRVCREKAEEKRRRAGEEWDPFIKLLAGPSWSRGCRKSRKSRCGTVLRTQHSLGPRRPLHCGAQSTKQAVGATGEVELSIEGRIVACVGTQSPAKTEIISDVPGRRRALFGFSILRILWVSQ